MRKIAVFQAFCLRPLACTRTGMILFLSSVSIARDCAAKLGRELRTEVQVMESAREARARLQSQSFDVVVVDCTLLECEATAVQVLLRQAGDAVPVFVNLAICGLERLVSEVRSALHRRRHDRQAALESALRSLRASLREDVTALLVSSQLALASSALTPIAEAKLRAVCELAERMSSRLNE